MFFVGTYDLSIDNKNRLSIPYAIRTKLDPDADGLFYYVVPGERKGTLALYPDKYFERRHAELPEAKDVSATAYEWMQFQFSQSALCEPDNQGRILIPERLLKRAGIGNEAMLIGVRDHLELWDRKDFEAFEEGKWPAYPEHRKQAQEEVERVKEQEALKSLKKVQAANEMQALMKGGLGSNGNGEKPEKKS